MKFPKFAWIPALVMVLALAGPASAAQKMYVSDRLQVTVRSGPSVDNKVLHVVKSGDVVTVVEKGEGGWVKVQLPNGESGWMIARYLQEDKPAALKLKELDPQAKDLMQKVEELGKANQELKTRLAQAEKEAQQAKRAYLELKQESGDYMKLKARYEALKKEFTAQAQRLDQLSAEAESLRFANNLKWFLAGAGVLFLGWLMGLALGRRKRRWSSGLH